MRIIQVFDQPTLNYFGWMRTTLLFFTRLLFAWFKYLTNQHLILYQNENPTVLLHSNGRRVIQVFDQLLLNFGPKWEPHHSFLLDRLARDSSIWRTHAEFWTKMKTSPFFFYRLPCAWFKYLTNQRWILDQHENPTSLFHSTAMRVIQVFDQPTLNFCHLLLIQTYSVIPAAIQNSFFSLLTNWSSDDGKTHKFEIKQNFRKMVYFSCRFRFGHVELT